MLLSLWLLLKVIWRCNIAVGELWLQLEAGSGEVVAIVLHLMMCLLTGTTTVGVLVTSWLQLGIATAYTCCIVIMIKQLASVRGNAVSLVHLGWRFLNDLLDRALA